MRDHPAKILFQSFLQAAIGSNSDMGGDVHSLMLSLQDFLCRPRRHPPSKVPWRMVLERLSWRDKPEPCKFPSLDSCQKRFLWTPKDVDHARTQSLVLYYKQPRRCRDVSSGTFCVRSLDPFYRVSKQGPCFTAVEEDGCDEETCTARTCL